LAVTDESTDGALGLVRLPVRLAASWALRDVGMARVGAWVGPGNLATQALPTAAGFTRERLLRSFLSLNGRRADAVVFSRTTQDLQGSPDTG